MDGMGLKVVALPGAAAPVKRGHKVDSPPKAAALPYAPGAKRLQPGRASEATLDPSPLAPSVRMSYTPANNKTSTKEKAAFFQGRYCAYGEFKLS